MGYLYAMTSDPTTALGKPIVSLLELIPLCGGCPSDWEARDHLGREVYIRYRWGHLRVEIDQQVVWSVQHGDPLDGMMSVEEMVPLTREAIDWVEHRIHYPAST